MGRTGPGYDCLQNSKKDQEKGSWRDDKKCNYESSFLCKKPPKLILGRAKIVQRYIKEELGFSIFQVWYKLNAANQSQLNSWKDKRMTGFKLSWRLENTPMTLTSSELGQSIETPQLRQKQFERTLYEKDRT